ncbi:phosphoribosyltransferase domain-containing protein [Variovorax sp. J22R133]|uniref:phosphoribosyltransferase domain-containing protein n=1 Tax=Variovorax brevis TaxID=3053503 RepID=UPI0025786731|nr:phosphoribosyltransferase domain-containing protein [Variovorax sp. J22R133]MDM0115185.1 phosphoribosyltransferase domain-containing protein [Variovorax sp. J22R133]
MQEDAMRAQVELPTGCLKISLDRADWPLHELCGFAARHNPKRGFLFVSKVLGKHWPCKPSVMRAAHFALATKLAAPGDAPALFIGLAETATGLGQGVFEQYLERFGQGSALYVQTTRYPLSGAQMLPFLERHSHAQNLRLHVPEREDWAGMFKRARLLVLVDDELSTGDTCLSLIAAYGAQNPALEEIAAVSLSNFMGEAGQVRFREQLALLDVAGATPRKVSFPALVEGQFNFSPNASFFQAPPPPAAQADMGCRRAYNSAASARLGSDSFLALPESLVDGLAETLPRDKPVLVLGSGEFMHPAYVLGTALEEAGLDVRIQSTTRSPVLMGASIGSRQPLPDLYGEGIPNALYNFKADDYGAVLLCHECPEGADDGSLATSLQLLGARGIAFNRGIDA